MYIMISSITKNFLYNNKVQIFPSAFRKRNVCKIGTPFGTFARQVEKLGRRLACWDAMLKHWHAVWDVRTFISTFASKNDMQARFWHVNNAVPAHIGT